MDSADQKAEMLSDSTAHNLPDNNFIQEKAAKLPIANLQPSAASAPEGAESQPAAPESKVKAAEEAGNTNAVPDNDGAAIASTASYPKRKVVIYIAYVGAGYSVSCVS